MRFILGQRLLELAMILAVIAILQLTFSLFRPDIISINISLYIAYGTTGICLLLYLSVLIIDSNEEKKK